MFANLNYLFWLPSLAETRILAVVLRRNNHSDDLTPQEPKLYFERFSWSTGAIFDQDLWPRFLELSSIHRGIGRSDAPIAAYIAVDFHSESANRSENASHRKGGFCDAHRTAQIACFGPIYQAVLDGVPLTGLQLLRRERVLLTL